MKRIYLSIVKFARRVEIPPRYVKTFLREHFSKTFSKNHVELSRREYKVLRDYFSFEREMVALIFFSHGRKPPYKVKNVIKLIKTSPGVYCYQWYRYVMQNGVFTRVKIGEISVDGLNKTRVWRSPVDRSVIILNENDNFEALSRLPSTMSD